MSCMDEIFGKDKVGDPKMMASASASAVHNCSSSVPTSRRSARAPGTELTPAATAWACRAVWP